MAARKAKATSKATEDPDKVLRTKPDPTKSDARRLVDVSLNPAALAMLTTRQFNKSSFGEQPLTESFEALGDQIAAVQIGDLSHQRAMLAGQASSLNAIFGELARRAGVNMGEYVNAAQIYMRLALKAQAQCRSTIEALDRLVNGHEQTVKHVHVGQGGQAVVADQFHHHTGGQENGNSVEQPHATGTSAAGPSAALPCPDPLGHGMPITSRERQTAMQDARGQG